MTWTQQQQHVGGSSIASSGSTFVIVGDVGSIYSSPNVTDWIKRATTVGSKSLKGVTHGHSMFVAVGESGMIVTSPDGAGWTTQVDSTTKDLADVAYGPMAQ